jgi:hypothetical protein
VRFYVFLRPGHSGFEKGLQAAYGLARDKHVDQELAKYWAG